MFFHRKSAVIYILTILLMIQLLSANSILAAENHIDHSKKFSPLVKVDATKDNPSYKPGQLVVKLKSGDVSQLDQLNMKHNVHGLSPVIKQPEGDPSATVLERPMIPSPTVAQDTYSNEQKEPFKVSKIDLIKRLEHRQLRSTSVSGSSLDNVFLLKMPDNQDVMAAADEYANNSAVAWAEPNYIVTVKMVPDDPYYGSSNTWGQGTDDLWGLKQLQPETVWDETQGEGVIIAVADTGLYYNHEDIKDNAWINEDEIPDNGIDDDLNGYVDDYYGYDFFNNDGDPTDDNGHGTYVAGIAAAAGNNSLGIIGVAPKAKVMGLKGMSADGSGDEITMANCIYYAVNNGADIINNSWGGPGHSRLVQDAIDYAYSHGCVVVAAAGNEDGNVINSFPANCQHVISVGGTEAGSNTKAFFSNWGPGVDVCAPACSSNMLDPASILSLLAPESLAAQYMPDYIVGDKYLRLYGTSSSSPYISGLAALLLARFPSDSNDDIKGRITTSAVPLAYANNSEDEDLYFGSQMIGAGTANAPRAISATEIPYFKFVAADMTVIEGNINQVVDPGETVKIHVTLENLWKPASVKADLSVDPVYTQYVDQITKSSSDFGSIGQGEKQDNIDDQFVIKMGNFNFETPITFNLNINADGQIQLLRFRLYPGSTALVQDRVDITNMDGDGSKVVWVDYQTPGQNHIYSYNIPQNQYIRLTKDSAVDPTNPDISLNRVVWEDMGNIYLYDFNTGETRQITDDTNNQSYPQTYGSKVIWQDDRNGGLDVFMFDLDTGTETRISSQTVTDAVAPDINARISRNMVVWLNGTQICVYNLTSGQERQITIGTASKSNLSLYGNMIAYEDARETSKAVFLYDLTTDLETLAISPELYPQNPFIKDGFIAYKNTSGKGDIWLHDITVGTDMQITRCYSTEDYPVIFDRKLAWLDSRNGTVNGWPGTLNTSIRMTDLSRIQPAPPTVEVSGQADTIYGNWYSGDAPNSVVEFVYSLGTSECSDDVIKWSSAGINKSTILSGLALSPGTYYFNVKERDESGVWSEPGFAQLIVGKPGDLTFVNDGIGTDIDYTSKAETLSANWGVPTDPNFVVKRYLYAIGTIPGGRDIVDWTDNGSAQTATKSGLILNSGIKYYFSIKAESTSGILTNPIFSDGQTVDLTVPIIQSTVNDGTGVDIRYSASRNTISANWAAAKDPESGIFGYSYAVGTAPGRSNVISWTDNGSDLSFTRSDLRLQNGVTYYTSVKAINGAGSESVTVVSNGQTVDSTPPIKVLRVNDGLAMDIKTTTSTTSLSANWLASFDLISGISKYMYAIGTSPGKTDVVNWTDNGRSTRVTKSGLSLTPGQTYYFTVIAINGAGLSSSPSSSNGQKVVNKPKRK
ncbi:MAG: S8 family serine peptidase [Acidobacteriota bacterium]